MRIFTIGLGLGAVLAAGVAGGAATAAIRINAGETDTARITALPGVNPAVGPAGSRIDRPTLPLKARVVTGGGTLTMKRSQAAAPTAIKGGVVEAAKSNRDHIDQDADTDARR